MSKEYYISIYPGRYNEDGLVCLLETVPIDNKDIPAYNVFFTNTTKSVIQGGKIDFIIRRVEELLVKIGNKANIIVDMTHHGETILDYFKNLKVDSVHGVILSEVGNTDESCEYIITNKDLFGNLYLLKDGLRVGFSRDSPTPKPIVENLFNGIDDFVIRNIDAPITHAYTWNENNQYDNYYYVTAIGAWYAEFSRVTNSA